jgi:hypothetical protein
MEAQHQNVKTGDVFISRAGDKYIVIYGFDEDTGECAYPFVRRKYALKNEKGQIFPNCNLSISMWEKPKDQEPYHVRLYDRYVRKETNEIWEIISLSRYSRPSGYTLKNCKTGKTKTAEYLSKFYWNRLFEEEEV